MRVGADLAGFRAHEDVGGVQIVVVHATIVEAADRTSDGLE